MTSFQGSTKPPVATTVFFGANDAALAGRTSERQHVPVEEYKENLRRIVHHLKVQIPHFVCLLYARCYMLKFSCLIYDFSISNSTFHMFVACLDALGSWPK